MTRSERFEVLALLALALVLAGGCSSNATDASPAIGPAGGTVTSADGKLKIVIPPGALSSPVHLVLTNQVDGETPKLLAGSRYALDAPQVTLALPAQAVYTIGSPPWTSLSAATSSPQSFYGDCGPGTPICNVLLGTGTCPGDHPRFIQLRQLNGYWTLACGLPQPTPVVSLLSPSPLVLGGLYDAPSGTLTANLSSLQATTLAVLLDSSTLTATSDKTTIQPIDTFHLALVENGAAPISKVEIWHMGATVSDGSGNYDNGNVWVTNVKVTEAAAPPSTATVNVNTVPPGTHIFAAIAIDPNGGRSITDAIAIQVDDGSVANTLAVNLSASPTSITTTGSSTLTATVTGASGAVQKVEFFEGASKLGEATASPYTLPVAYTVANNGSHVYTAKATDAAGHVATSNTTTVDVAIPAPAAADYYADPVGGSDANPGTLAQPFATIAHAASVATAGQTIGLLDGTFREGAPVLGCDGRAITIKGGLTLRAVHPRAAIISNITLGVSTGSLSIYDLTVDGPCTAIVSSSSGAGATLAISGAEFSNGAHIALSNGVIGTLSPGSLGAASIITMGKAPLVSLTGTSQLTIQGGSFDGADMGSYAGGGYPLLYVQNSAQLVLDATTLKNLQGNGIALSGSSSVTLQNGTTLDTVGLSGPTAGAIVQSDGTLTLSNATIKNSAGAAIRIRGGTLSTLTVTGSTINHNARGIYFNDGDSGAVTLTMSGSQITQNTGVGLSLWPNGDYAVGCTLRNTVVTGNTTGIELYAGGGSVLDLGTTGTAGGNTIQNTGVGLTVNGPVAGTVDAVGNTWLPSEEGADANGHYTAGTSVVGPVTTGLNYRIANASTLDL